MASSKIDLYYYYVSAPGRAVKTFLISNGIDFVEHVVDVMKGEHKQPAYLEVNPAGLLPSIKDGDFKLGESAAILVYLADTRKTPDHWYPADAKKRARVNEYLHSHHSNLRSASMGVLMPKVFNRLGNPSAPVDEAAIKQAEEKLDSVLKTLNARLSTYKFLGGDEISIADILAAEEVVIQDVYHFDLSAFPKVQSWLSIVKETSGWAQVHEPLAGFFQFAQSTLKF